MIVTSVLFSYTGIRAVAECLAKSNAEETQDCARNLLQQLSNVRLKDATSNIFVY